MAVIVEPVLPFSSSKLHLGAQQYWTRLLPLINPKYAELKTPDGRVLLINKALAASDNVPIAATISANNLSTKFLAEDLVALVAVEHHEDSISTGYDFATALELKALQGKGEIIVVRTGSENKLEVLCRAATKILQVEVAGNLLFDHLLSLLATIKPEVKASFENVATVVDLFLKSSKTVSSSFQTSKAGDSPARQHASATVGVKSAQDSVLEDLDTILGSFTSSQTGVTYSVHYSDINGLARLENLLLAHEISGYFETHNLPFRLTQSTIFNRSRPARGWGISICPTPEKFLAVQTPVSKATSPVDRYDKATISSHEVDSKVQLDEAEVRQRTVAGCQSLIEYEPLITEYDTIVGDGDCGYTLRDGAKRVLKFINSQKSLSPLPQTLTALVDDLESNIGGTSGALYCIFLSSLAQTLRDEPTFPDALFAAQNHLLKYTKARIGDRTCIDCLIPFVETLKQTGDARVALQAALEGVKKTSKLQATLGRSAYVDEAATFGVPDPGAFGLLKLLEGMVNLNWVASSET